MRHAGPWLSSAILSLTLVLSGCGDSTPESPKLTPDAIKSAPPANSVMPGMADLDAQKAKGIKGMAGPKK